MALSAKTVKSLLSNAGLEEDKVKEIAEAILKGHSESLDYLQGQIDELAPKAKNVEQITKERDDALAALKDTKSGKTWKELHDELADARAKESKSALIREALLKAGATESAAKLLTKAMDLGTVEIDDKGVLKDSDGLVDSLKKEYPESFKKETRVPEKNPAPPKGANDKATGGKDSEPGKVLSIAEAMRLSMSEKKGD